MAEGILWFCILLNLGVCVLNIRGWRRFKKLIEKELDLCEKDLHLIFEHRNALWKQMGAYETENGRMYLDLEGIRLVIFEGKIEGWYIP